MKVSISPNLNILTGYFKDDVGVNDIGLFY